MFFTQYAGITMLVIYAINVLQDLKVNEGFEINILVALQLINLTSVIAAFFGPKLQSRIGQKRTMQIGMLVLMVALFSIVAFN